MNNLIKFVALVFLLLTIILPSCKKEELPTLSTSMITDITSTSATGGGNISSDGNADVTVRGVCWSLNANPATSASRTSDGAGTGQFVSTITGLSAGLTYHVRAYATNSVGTAYGADLSFATLGNAPECITKAATNITSSGATLNATVNANYLSTTITFEYGVTTSYGLTVTSAQSPVTGNSITNVSADLSGLTPGTTYHYRVSAVNSIGTTNGNDLSFTTGAVLPMLTTTLISNKTATTVTTGGNITSNGGAAVTARGVCWATHENPTVSDSRTLDGVGVGSFTSEIGCLSFATSYYVRAYAINSVGTVYGDQLSFTTLGTNPIIFNPALTYGLVTDVDGNCYKTIQMGGQVWMAENLKTSRYNDGTPLPNVTDPVEWVNLLTKSYPLPNHELIYEIVGAFCWYNNDSSGYENEYGKLYNFGAAESGKLCPTGWHVPTSNEWKVLEDFLGGSYDAGGRLKEEGTTHWDEPNYGAINTSGFSALPAGFFSIEYMSGPMSLFDGLGYYTGFWSSSEADSLTAFSRSLSSEDHIMGSGFDAKFSGLSVRCLKNN